jgi:hypothetical protein
VQSVNETCRIICRARGEYTPIAFENESRASSRKAMVKAGFSFQE